MCPFVGRVIDTVKINNLRTILKIKKSWGKFAEAPHPLLFKDDKFVLRTFRNLIGQEKSPSSTGAN
jgi:hypothetical protein